jgi:hypothetical protein
MQSSRRIRTTGVRTADLARDVIGDVSITGPPKKLRILRECGGQEMGDWAVVPIMVPSRERADVAYLNFDADEALGKEGGRRLRWLFL